MSASLLIPILWKTGLCAAAALLALKLLDRHSAAKRSLVAHLGLAIVLAVAVATVAAPAWEVETSPPLAAYLNPVAAEPESSLLAQPMKGQARVGAFDWGTWAYLLPAASLLLSLLVGTARLSSIRTRASRLADPAWLQAFEAVRRRTGFTRKVALLVSEEVGSPLSGGVFRPLILLDRNTFHQPEQAEAVLSHELAHIARGDWLKLLLGSVATALLWFNPLVWILVRHCNEICEEAADDAVLRHEIAGADYASLLLSVARDRRNSRHGLSNAMVSGRGSLRRRVMRVLESGRDRSLAKRKWRIACLAVAGSMAVPLALLSPVAAEAGPPLSPSSGPRDAKAQGNHRRHSDMSVANPRILAREPSSGSPSHSGRAEPQPGGWVLEPDALTGKVIKRPATASEIAEIQQAAKTHEDVVARLRTKEVELDRAAKELATRETMPALTGAALEPPAEAVTRGQRARSAAAPVNGTVAEGTPSRGRLIPASELPVVATGGQSIEVLPGGNVMLHQATQR